MKRISPALIWNLSFVAITNALGKKEVGVTLGAHFSRPDETGCSVQSGGLPRHHSRFNEGETCVRKQCTYSCTWETVFGSLRVVQLAYARRVSRVMVRGETDFNSLQISGNVTRRRPGFDPTKATHSQSQALANRCQVLWSKRAFQSGNERDADNYACVFSLLRLFRTDLSSIPSALSTNLTPAAEACATRPLVVSRQLAATNHNGCKNAEFYRQLRRLPCYRQKMQKSCWLSGSLSVAATSAKCFTQYSLCSSKIKGIVVFVRAKT